MAHKNVNFLIVDDHPIFRKGLISVFEEVNYGNKIFEASNYREMLEVLSKHSVDVITLDINLPDLDGINILKKLKKQFKGLKILIISMYNNPIIMREAIKKGAHGYLCKDNIYENLISAVETILSNKKYLNDEVKNFQNNIEEKKALYFSLSKTEKIIFKLVAEGKNCKEIGNILNRSHKTIENQRSSVMKKLMVKNMTEMIKIALKLNIIKI